MYLKIDDIHYFIRQSNTASQKNQSALILLHGFTGSSEDWEPFFKIYQDKYSVFAIDLIGHGRTDVPEFLEYYSMDSLVIQLEKIFKQLDLNSAHLLGYSMGGRIALSFAARYPEYVDSLILESATAGIEKPEERKSRQNSDEQIAKFIERNPIEKFVDRWLKHPIFNSLKKLPREKQQLAREMRLDNSPTGLANCLRGFGTGKMPHLWEKLPDISAPVLLISGNLDTKFTDIATRMSKKLPNTQQVTVPEAGHNIHFERSRIFTEITSDFLNDR